MVGCGDMDTCQRTSQPIGLARTHAGAYVARCLSGLSGLGPQVCIVCPVSSRDKGGIIRPIERQKALKSSPLI